MREERFLSDRAASFIELVIEEQIKMTLRRRGALNCMFLIEGFRDSQKWY